MERSEFIGGERTLVYRNLDSGEVVKLVASDDERVREDRLAGFGRAFMSSACYSALGIMPEIIEVGGNYQGTGRPYVREQFVPGRPLDRLFPEDPDLWIRRLPGELVRIYEKITAGADWAAGRDWEKKIAAVPRIPGVEAITDVVLRAGERLRARSCPAYQIHGDLRLGRMLASGDRVVLHGWEDTELMTLAYEFAQLRASLTFPEVFPPLGPWDPAFTAPALLRLAKELRRAIPGRIARDDDVELAVRFRIGGVWLEDLGLALDRGDLRTADEIRGRLERLTKAG